MIRLFLLFVFIGSCGKLKVTFDPAESPLVETPPTDTTPKVAAQVQVRNFDQIYNTMSRLTNVHPSEAVIGVGTQKIYQEFAALKSQLPNERDASAFSSFNQIASARLAFMFCNNYIEKNPEFIVLTKEAYIKHLVENFLGENPETFADFADVSLILNELLDETSALKYMPSQNSSDLKKRYKVACTALLSSNYILVLRSLE